jgi:hypothetical protein
MKNNVARFFDEKSFEWKNYSIEIPTDIIEGQCLCSIHFEIIYYDEIFLKYGDTTIDGQGWIRNTFDILNSYVETEIIKDVDIDEFKILKEEFGENLYELYQILKVSNSKGWIQKFLNK